MGRAGIEHDAHSAEKHALAQQDGAESGARGDRIDPNLAEVVTAWPALAAGVRASILAMVRALNR